MHCSLWLTAVIEITLSGCTVLLITKKIYKIIIIVKLDSAAMTKGMSSGSVHCILNLSRTSQYPPPAVGDFYAPGRNSFSSNIGRILWFFVLLQRCPLRELYLEDWVHPFDIKVERMCGGRQSGNVITLREGAALWAAVGQVLSPYLVEAAAERAVMSSRSGGVSGRATGN